MEQDRSTEPTQPLEPAEYRDRKQSLREERKQLQQGDRRSKYEARASVLEEKEARVRAKMANIRLKIERLQDRAKKHEARHAEMLGRSRELPAPLTTQAQEKVVGAAKGAMEQTRGALKRAGEVAQEKAGQLGGPVKEAGSRARAAIGGEPPQETYATYERIDTTKAVPAAPLESGGEGGERITGEVSSRFSQGTPRKGDGPKIEESETQSEGS